MRVVSLLAASTEIVCALGYEAALVGRSHECDFPASVERLPVCTRPRFAVGGTSAEIDAAVRELARRGAAEDALGVYEVLAERLAELAPTHIVTQTQCEVCAVSLRDVEQAVRRMTRCEAQLISLAPNTLADVWEDFRRVARALGDAEAGERLVGECRARIEAVSRRVAGPPVRVAVVEWADPPMTAGNWTPALVAVAGGEDLFGREGEHSGYIEWEAVRAADPEAIVVAPCGYSLERAAEELPLLERLPGWCDMNAVRASRVFVADGNRFFNRPGPRLAETVEILAEMLHPETFRFGHEGDAWRRAA